MFLGGAVASVMVSALIPGPSAVRVRTLAGVTVLCSWARNSTLTVPLSTQEYKWVPKKLRGSDLRWTRSISRGSRNTPSRFMLKEPGWAPAAMSLGSKASRTTLDGLQILSNTIKHDQTAPNKVSKR